MLRSLLISALSDGPAGHSRPAEGNLRIGPDLGGCFWGMMERDRLKRMSGLGWAMKEWRMESIVMLGSMCGLL